MTRSVIWIRLYSGSQVTSHDNDDNRQLCTTECARAPQGRGQCDNAEEGRHFERFKYSTNVSILSAKL